VTRYSESQLKHCSEQSFGGGLNNELANGSMLMGRSYIVFPDWS